MPCHGQEVEGFGNVPDLQDRFPRVVADEANLGKNQEQSTNKGDLSIGDIEFNPGNVTFKDTKVAGASKTGKANLKLWKDVVPASTPGGSWRYYPQVNAQVKKVVPGKDGTHCMFGADNTDTLEKMGNQQMFLDDGHSH